jgi:hypothetical protein
MAENIKRKGYGQVEPNHLSGIVEGRIYAQLPAATVTTTTTGEGANAQTTTTITPIAQLEQGQFAKYDYAAGVVNFDGEGEFMLVYNEEKLYDERKQNHKDFVYKASDFTDGKAYPRLIATEVGDIITTNTIAVANTSDEAEVVIGTDATLVVGAYLAPSTSTGFLTVANNKPNSGMVWKIVKVYTMPDGQPGFKIQRIQ